MGHVRLSTLPNTAAWRRVTGLLDERAPHVTVIGAAAAAIERDLTGALDHPALAEAVRLLAGLPTAAQSDDYSELLARLGLKVPSAPGFLGLLQAAGTAIDEQNGWSGRNDFGELVRNALVESISASVGPLLSSPFRANADDTKSALARLADHDAFSAMAGTFFARLTRDSLSYYLSRTLSARIGPDSAFASVGDRDSFDGALDRHCREAAGVLTEFARAWHARASLEPGVAPEGSRSFAAVSMRRMLAELSDADPIDA